MRRYFIDEIENMRDIGGYAIGKNKIVAEGKIIRSNLPTNLSESNVKKLQEMKFTTIIDLRNDEEIKSKKSVFVDNPNFKYYHIKINGDGRLPINKDEILDTYIEMLEGKKQIEEIFKILEETNDGVIYYCNAGKDRTGVITALILKVLGVNENDIVVDYLSSAVYMKDKIKEYTKQNNELFDIINPKPETMFNLLNYIDNTYNSIEAYLENCNITRNMLNRIREKYTREV